MTGCPDSCPSFPLTPSLPTNCWNAFLSVQHYPAFQAHPSYLFTYETLRTPCPKGLTPLLLFFLNVFAHSFIVLIILENVSYFPNQHISSTRERTCCAITFITQTLTASLHVSSSDSQRHLKLNHKKTKPSLPSLGLFLPPRQPPPSIN